MTDAPSVSVLVLGGSGFLGAQVVAAAHAAEKLRPPTERRRVASASREPARAPAFWIPRDAVDEYAVDALVPNAVEELIERLRPSRVILVAALSHIHECEAYPELARALNVELARRAARAAERARARFVLVSTDLVFGAEFPPPGGFREADRVAAVNVYGQTKAQGELAVLENAPNALVVRLPLLFGDSGGRGLGASDALIEALRSGAKPTLFRDEWRTPLDVRNAARALLELAHGPAQGILHLAGPVRLSRVELAHLVLRAAGKKSSELGSLIRVGVRADLGLAAVRPTDVSLDASRALEWLRTPILAPREALAREARHLFGAIP